jgi:hypothetical protein
MTPHEKQRLAMASLAPRAPTLFVQPVTCANPSGAWHVYVSTGDGMECPELGTDILLVVIAWNSDARDN